MFFLATEILGVTFGEESQTPALNTTMALGTPCPSIQTCVCQSLKLLHLLKHHPRFQAMGKVRTIAVHCKISVFIMHERTCATAQGFSPPAALKIGQLYSLL